MNHYVCITFLIVGRSGVEDCDIVDLGRRVSSRGSKGPIHGWSLRKMDGGSCASRVTEEGCLLYRNRRQQCLLNFRTKVDWRGCHSRMYSGLHHFRYCRL
jgi:hypothetical protein